MFVEEYIINGQKVLFLPFTIFLLQTASMRPSVSMIMLTGIKAFEARWQANKSNWDTKESRMLMQAMSRLVDNYATYEEIEEELPASLQGAFKRLVDAYLNGFWLEDEDSCISSAAMLSPAMLAAQQLRQQRRMQRAPKPTPASEAATYIIRDRSAFI